MMAVHPDLVVEDRFQKDGHPIRSELASQVKRYRWMHDATGGGNFGDPGFGTAEKGERFSESGSRCPGPRRRRHPQ